MSQVGTHLEDATGLLVTSPSREASGVADAEPGRKPRVKTLPPPPPLAAYVQRVDAPARRTDSVPPLPSQRPAAPELPKLTTTPSSDWSELATDHFGSSVRAPKPQGRAWVSMVALGVGAVSVLSAGFAVGLSQLHQQTPTVHSLVQRSAMTYVAPSHPAIFASTSRAAQPARVTNAAQPARVTNAAQPARVTNAAQPARVTDAVPALVATKPATALDAAPTVVATKPAAAINAAPAVSATQPTAVAHVIAPTAQPEAHAITPPSAALTMPAAQAKPNASSEHMQLAHAQTVEPKPNAQTEAPSEAPLQAARAVAHVAPAVDEDLPEQPSRDDIKKSFEALRPALEACTANTHGTTFANVTISGNGHVSYSTVEGAFAGSPAGSCMARALRSASFPRFTSTSLTVRFPFVL